jgi:hypothetical protein
LFKFSQAAGADPGIFIFAGLIGTYTDASFTKCFLFFYFAEKTSYNLLLKEEPVYLK